MGIRIPDHFLDVDTGSLGSVLGDMLAKTEAVILAERPDALLVLGDTNSCIAALMARRMQVPVYHMEAGNRCFDPNVPEETNRRIVDHVADFNLVYTEHARRNLLAEGLHPRRILLTGSPMSEVLTHHADQFAASTVLADLGLHRREFLLVSAHREENVDSPARLSALLDCLAAAQRAYRPADARLHPPAHSQAARRAAGRHRTGGPRRHHLAHAAGVRGLRAAATGGARACCPTPARSARSPRCWRSPRSRCATRSSGPRPWTPARS